MSTANRFRQDEDMNGRFSAEARSRRDEIARDAPLTSVPAADLLPWLAPDARDDLKRGYNLRMPETYFRKLDWLEEQGLIRSKARFLLDVVLPAIDDAVEDRLRSSKA